METSLDSIMVILRTSGFKAVTAKLATLEKATLETIRAEALIAGKAKGGNFNQFYDVASEIVIHLMNLNHA